MKRHLDLERELIRMAQGLAKKEVKICAVCGGNFDAEYSFQKYCSPVCYREAAKYKRREKYGKFVTCPHCHVQFPVALVWKGKGGRR